MSNGISLVVCQPLGKWPCMQCGIPLAAALHLHDVVTEGLLVLKSAIRGAWQIRIRKHYRRTNEIFDGYVLTLLDPPIIIRITVSEKKNVAGMSI